MNNDQNTLFVGNLPFKTSEQELQDMFSQFGTIVEIKIPTDRETGRAKGFAFVTFEAADAVQAASSMDGKDLGGRPLRVNKAQGKQNSGGGGGRFDGGRGGGRRNSR